MLSLLYVQSQSIQSARLSIPSSELGPSIPSPARDCCSPPLWVQGGRHTRLRGRGWRDPVDVQYSTIILLRVQYIILI
jgi:hypothetical protein